jgi:NAD(P)-dependent dehydrogenase (short-subunit alcohol dehydrogenase family)
MRQVSFSPYADGSLVKHLGNTEEVAGAVIFPMQNNFMTGSTLYPDGGFALR